MLPLHNANKVVLQFKHVPVLRTAIEITDYDKGLPTTQVRTIQSQSY